MARRSPPRASRCVAKECRNACGVALSGNPTRRAAGPSPVWTIRGDNGPPLAPTNSGWSAGRSYGQSEAQIRSAPALAATAGPCSFSRPCRSRPQHHPELDKSVRRRSDRASERCASPSRRAARAPPRRAPGPRARVPRRHADRRRPRSGRPDRQRLGQRAPHLRRPHRRQRTNLSLVVAFEKAGERTHAGQRSRTSRSAARGRFRWCSSPAWRATGPCSTRS